MAKKESQLKPLIFLIDLNVNLAHLENGRIKS